MEFATPPAMLFRWFMFFWVGRIFTPIEGLDLTGLSLSSGLAKPVRSG